MKKNKLLLSLTVLAVLLFISACSSSQHLVVRFYLDEKKAVDFPKYEEIVLGHFNILFPDNAFDPLPGVQEFFKEDFAKTFNREVIIKPTLISYFKNPDECLEELTTYGNNVYITGNGKVEVKKRSVIKDIKDEKGKKKRDFVKIEHWSMEIEFVIIESRTGKILYQRALTEKLYEVDDQNLQYNFDDLFFKASNKFIHDLMKKRKRQERTILNR